MSQIFSGKEHPAIFNIWKKQAHLVSIPVRGKSMFPLIDDLDLVTVAETSPQNIQPGDIIAFVSNGSFVVHRVVRLKGNGKDIVFCQKGDSSPFYTWIGADEVLGRVIEIKSNARSISLTSYPWKFYNSFIGLLGSFWVFISGGGKEEPGFLEKKWTSVRKVKRTVFLALKMMSFSLTSLLIHRY